MLHFSLELASLTAQNFDKVNHLEACNTASNFDIICGAVSFRDSRILTENNNLKVNGYTIARADHRSNVKIGVCLY